MSGTTDQDDLMDIQLINLGALKDLLNRFKSIMEEILAELFKTGTSEGSVEINTLIEQVNFDRCLGGRKKGTLSMLASSVETMNSTSV